MWAAGNFRDPEHAFEADFLMTYHRHIGDILEEGEVEWNIRMASAEAGEAPASSAAPEKETTSKRHAGETLVASRPRLCRHASHTRLASINTSAVAAPFLASP